MSQDMNTPNGGTKPFANPIKPIFNTFLVLVIGLGIAYAAVNVAPAFDIDPARKEFYRVSEVTVGNALRSLWDFFQPIAQLAVVVLVAEWILNKFGVNIKRPDFKFDWNIQSIIAIIIVASFCLSALGGLGATSGLKDVVLVVVGFYFGSQKKSISVRDANDKTVNVSQEGPPSSLPPLPSLPTEVS